MLTAFLRRKNLLFSKAISVRRMALLYALKLTLMPDLREDRWMLLSASACNLLPLLGRPGVPAHALGPGRLCPHLKDPEAK